MTGHNVSQKETVDTLIWSDPHLGSELCKAGAIRRMFDRFEYARRITNGDLFDHLNFEPSARVRHKLEGKPYNEKKNRLKKSHLEILRRMSGSAKPAAHHEEIWIEGNHDEGLADILACLVGMTVHQEYEWQYRGERFLVIHGDQFDEFYWNNRFLANVATWIYARIQSLGPWAYPLCRFLKRGSKKYTRAIDLVAERAIAYAKKRGAQHVICGHTHLAEHRVVDGVHYYNSGSWDDFPCHCITVDDRGVKMREFSKEGVLAKTDLLYAFPDPGPLRQS